LNRLDEVLKEVPKVRKELGYPPLVTPTSQLVGIQAVLNVISGKRYAIIPKEIKDYVKGLYGKPPAPIEERIRKIIVGNEETITCRPADLLEPSLNKIPDDVKPYIESEEDRITYALFPQTALEFFKKRKSKRQEVNVDIQPERLSELQEVAAVSVAIVNYLQNSSRVKALTLSRSKNGVSYWVLSARQNQVGGGA
jgi:oxaloacetate decarboxylase alpha subunit